MSSFFGPWWRDSQLALLWDLKPFEKVDIIDFYRGDEGMKESVDNWTVTIDDPDHVRLPVGAQIKVGNNDELRGAGLEPLPGVWKIVKVHDPELGKQRYDVERISINRHQLRAALTVQKK